MSEINGNQWGEELHGVQTLTNNSLKEKKLRPSSMTNVALGHNDKFGMTSGYHKT